MTLIIFQVDMEVATEHPFFVYGQGWASCNPELTYKAFGLKCQRLQVGDICISLTKRKPPNIIINNNYNNNNNIINSNNNNNKHMYSHDTTTTTTTTTTRTTTNESHCLERDLQPLVLNDNVYAAHLKSAGICPPPTAPYPIMRGAHGGTVHFMPPHLLANASATVTHPAPYAPNERYPHFPFPTSPAQAASTPLHSSRAQHGDLTCAAQSPTNSSTRSADECAQSVAAAAAAAASARKRRWSAPESFSNSEDEDDEAARSGEYQPPLRQKSAPTAAVSSNYKPYMPTNMNMSATAAATAGQLNCDFSTNYK